MAPKKSPPENSSSTSSWFHKAVTVAVLAVIVGYAAILHQKNMILEKSMADYSRELRDINGEIDFLRSEKQALKEQLDKEKVVDDNLDRRIGGLEKLLKDEHAKELKKFQQNFDTIFTSSKKATKDILDINTKIKDMSTVQSTDYLDKRIGGIEKLLNHSNDEHSKELRKFQQNFDTIFTSSQKATKDIQDIQTKIKDMSTVLATDKTVAFYAFMGSNVDPGIHQPIVFNNVITNVGGAYNGQNGKFTAPHDGVYVFAWVLFCYEKGYLRSALVVNNLVFGHVDTDSGSGRNFISATGVVVVHIKQGDVVYVRTDSKKGGILSTGDKRTQFSGWKIN